MISVCIPVYNFSVENLVSELLTQANQTDIDIEIIVIDDGSLPEYNSLNKQLSDQVKYIELKKNIGRAAIRNRFTSYSSFRHLLFLDCDSRVVAPDFLRKYAAALKENPESVICGGREYGKKPSDRTKILRWKYGIQRESKNVRLRTQKPYRSFMTNNFLIPKKVLESVHFDERLVDYGHEDTLFGYGLKKNWIPVVHIDNPILNGHLEDNKTFLLNSEKAVDNLVQILQFPDYDREFIREVGLLKFYFQFQYMGALIRLKFFLFRPLMQRMLEKGRAGTILFSAYKLGILAVQMKNARK